MIDIKLDSAPLYTRTKPRNTTPQRPHVFSGVARAAVRGRHVMACASRSCVTLVDPVGVRSGQKSSPKIDGDFRLTLSFASVLHEFPMP
jgi:hypothetical protein